MEPPEGHEIRFPNKKADVNSNLVGPAIFYFFRESGFIKEVKEIGMISEAWMNTQDKEEVERGNMGKYT